MSIKVMSWVWEYAVLAAHELSTALAMADWASDDGNKIYPTVAQIAIKTRLSERSVQRIVQGLMERSVVILTAKSRRGHANEYRMLVPWNPAPTVEAASNMPVYEHSEEYKAAAQLTGDILSPDTDGVKITGDTCDPEGVTPATDTGDTPATTNRHTTVTQPLESSSKTVAWFEILANDARWSTKHYPVWGNEHTKSYIIGVEAQYPDLEMLAFEAHLAYEWLQTGPGKRKRRLRAFWNNWLRNKDRPPRATRPGGATRTEHLATSEELEKGWGGNGESSGHPQADS